MSSSSADYEPFYTRTFQNQYASLNRDMKELVDTRIENLLLDPYHNTEFGKGDYRGKRKLRINRRDRLFFVICEECRREGHRVYNQCPDCSVTPDNTVVIGFILFDHAY